MMPMRPFHTTANPLLLLYNTIYHFTSLAFAIQHQILTQQHQRYNTMTWKIQKKNEILAHCIISITHPIGQNDAYATLCNHCKALPFPLYYNISFYLACLWYSTSNTYSAAPRIQYNNLNIFKKNEILAHCIISITSPIGQNGAYATLSHHCKPSHFTL